VLVLQVCVLCEHRLHYVVCSRSWYLDFYNFGYLVQWREEVKRRRHHCQICVTLFVKTVVSNQDKFQVIYQFADMRNDKETNRNGRTRIEETRIRHPSNPLESSKMKLIRIEATIFNHDLERFEYVLCFKRVHSDVWVMHHTTPLWKKLKNVYKMQSQIAIQFTMHYMKLLICNSCMLYIYLTML
jgi:hypothetical protein